MNNIIEIMEAAANKFATGIKKEELAKRVRRELSAQGVEAIILNDRYIMAGGKRYQFIKKAGRFAVKEW